LSTTHPPRWLYPAGPSPHKKFCQRYSPEEAGEPTRVTVGIKGMTVHELEKKFSGFFIFFRPSTGYGAVRSDPARGGAWWQLMS